MSVDKSCTGGAAGGNVGNGRSYPHKKIRVGVIGGGAIAQACHIPGYAADKKCELTATADLGFKFKNIHADYREMLKQEQPLDRALMDMTVHAFDLVQWMIGPTKSASARVAASRKDIKVDDNVVSWIDIGGFPGYIEAGWTSCSGYTGLEIMEGLGAVYRNYNTGKATMNSGNVNPDGSIEYHETGIAAKKPLIAVEVKHE